MSEMGSLSGCILENDPDPLGRERRLRGEALIASVGLEGGLVWALLIWPLLSPGILGGTLTVTPLPPYRGAVGDVYARPRSLHPAVGKHEAPRVCLFCAQPAAPAHPSSSGDSRETSNSGAPDVGLAVGGDVSGPFLPGTGAGGNRLPIQK